MADSKGSQGPAALDRPLEPFRRELLELAFDAASSFPMEPHRKNRGQAQEWVVAGCFDLQQPKLALKFGSQINDWRRGTTYADYAWFNASRGVKDGMDRYLKLAQKIIDEMLANPIEQEWRIDSIRVKCARAWRAIGDETRAAQVVEGVRESSSFAVDASWADTVATQVEKLTEQEAGRYVATLDTDFQTQVLGDQNTSLVALVKIHRNHFGNRELREEIEQRLLHVYDKLPVTIRLDAIAQLIENHLAMEDGVGGLAVISRMQSLVDQFQWQPEDGIPQRARLAQLRIRAGDVHRARNDLEALLGSYHAQREEIFDITRCETLRPIAIGWHLLGERQLCDDLLLLAIEEAVENPNSRPRCDDLVQTCVDMARHGIEPSGRLWARLKEVRASLADPW